MVEIDWESIEYEKLLFEMCNLCHEFEKKNYVLIETAMYMDFFNMLLEKIPKTLKAQIFVHSAVVSKFFCYTFGLQAYKLLINDPDLASLRSQIYEDNKELIETVIKIYYGDDDDYSDEDGSNDDGDNDNDDM